MYSVLMKLNQIFALHFFANDLYDNILDKFEFECSKANFKVTVVIVTKHCHRSSALIYNPISI